MNTTSGSLASRPAAGNAGNLYFATDSPYVYRDNGTSWDNYGLLDPLSPPNDSLFSWVNQGTASTTTLPGGAVRLDGVNNGTADNHRMRVKATPATPYTLTMGFMQLYDVGTYKAVGLCLRESSTGKIIVLGVEVRLTSGNNALYYQTIVFTWTNPSTFSANKAQLPYASTTPFWLRITDDGTNHTFWTGVDPFNFRAVITLPRTQFLLTGADQYGFYVNPNAGDCSMIVVHLKEN